MPGGFVPPAEMPLMGSWVLGGSMSMRSFLAATAGVLSGCELEVQAFDGVGTERGILSFSIAEAHPPDDAGLFVEARFLAATDQEFQTYFDSMPGGPDMLLHLCRGPRAKCKAVADGARGILHCDKWRLAPRMSPQLALPDLGGGFQGDAGHMDGGASLLGGMAGAEMVAGKTAVQTRLEDLRASLAEKKGRLVPPAFGHREPGTSAAPPRAPPPFSSLAAGGQPDGRTQVQMLEALDKLETEIAQARNLTSSKPNSSSRLREELARKSTDFQDKLKVKKKKKKKKKHRRKHSSSGSGSSSDSTEEDFGGGRGAIRCDDMEEAQRSPEHLLQNCLTKVRRYLTTH